ncbi:MFS transporter [Vulcanisaeta distributa]|uniref:MFS transporter n=1 Tax=Vulcanisaeta distributa TaxID=164451 RepID=UPI000B24BFEC|nr:MFS transporter [Vulcanisaeta distributa]
MIGLILASYPFVEALSSFVAGYMADKLGGRRLTLILGYTWILIFMALIYLAIALLRNPLATAAFNGAMGFGAALVLVSTLAMITDLTEKGYRGLGMGVFDFTNIFGYALGYMMGSVLYQVIRGPMAFIILLMLLVILYAIVLNYIMETRPTIGAVYLNPLRGGVSRRVIPTLPIWFSITMILGAAIYSGRAIGSIKGVMPIHVGALFLGATLVVGLGSVFFGYVSDRLGRLRTMSIGVLGVSIGLIILTVLLLLGVNPIIAVAASAPFIFMASAVVPSILALTGDEALISMRGGSAMGLYSLVLGFGMGGLGSILGSYSYVKLGLGGIALLALVIFIVAFILYAVLRVILLRK